LVGVLSLSLYPASILSSLLVVQEPASSFSDRQSTRHERYRLATDERCNRCVEATAVKANRYYLMSGHPLLPEESKEPSFSIFPSGPDGDYLEQDISLI
jgi:hypothetical protein